jgi:hypothetical protein
VVSPLLLFGLRRCASTHVQELPSRLCVVPEVEPSLVLCGAFCLVEFTRQRVTKVPLIFALGSFNFCLDCCT